MFILDSTELAPLLELREELSEDATVEFTWFPTAPTVTVVTGLGERELPKNSPFTPLATLRILAGAPDGHRVTLRRSDDWLAKLNEWNAPRPSAWLVTWPFELLVVWKQYDAKAALLTKLFLHDVLKAEKLEPSQLSFSEHHVPQCSVLRFAPSKELVDAGGFELLNARHRCFA